MPARHGYAAQGGWGTGPSSGGSLPADVTMNSRAGNQPTEYVASNSIEFLPGFESGISDTFTAYIDATGGSGIGGSSGEGSGLYRYGYNGKENDNEVKGTGNQYDFGSRIYDSRTGRFFSVDPRINEFPTLSAYLYAANNPIAFIDEDGEGPKPAYDKTLEQRLNQRRLTTFVEVLKRCNNASMYALEAWGWRMNASQFSNDKIKGLAGEAIVVDYLRSMILFTNERKTVNGGGTLAPRFIPQAAASQDIYVGGWNDDKTVDISFKLDLGGKGANRLGITMPFNNADGSQINRGRGENYLKDVNFVIEVKTGTTISNFTKGFSQAIQKSKGVANAVPVVAMDDDAYKDAIEESPGLKAYADQFIKNGGRIMLIDGLNRSAEKAATIAKDEIRKGKNPYELKTAN
jgi:RHS repeat-associated protein